MSHERRRDTSFTGGDRLPARTGAGPTLRCAPDPGVHPAARVEGCASRPACRCRDRRRTQRREPRRCFLGRVRPGRNEPHANPVAAPHLPPPSAWRPLPAAAPRRGRLRVNRSCAPRPAPKRRGKRPARAPPSRSLTSAHPGRAAELLRRPTRLARGGGGGAPGGARARPTGGVGPLRRGRAAAKYRLPSGADVVLVLLRRAAPRSCARANLR